jgi:hypothetical protein
MFQIGVQAASKVWTILAWGRWFLMVSGPFLIKRTPTPDKKVSRKVCVVCVDSLAVWGPPE